jgi:hypothetical protein
MKLIPDGQTATETMEATFCAVAPWICIPGVLICLAIAVVRAAVAVWNGN